MVALMTIRFLMLLHLDAKEWYIKLSCYAAPPSSCTCYRLALMLMQIFLLNAFLCSTTYFPHHKPSPELES